MLKSLFASRRHPYIPNRDQLDKIEIDLSGSRLYLEMPPHFNYEGFAVPPPPRQIDIYDPQDYDGDGDVPEWQRENTATRLVFKRRWELRGPLWRAHPYGSISFFAVLTRCDALPESMSCFNPAHFEQVIVRKAYFRGPMSFDGRTYKAPVNWRLQQQAGNTWIYHEIREEHSIDDLRSWPAGPAHFMSYLQIPLDDRYYLSLNFSYLGYAPVDHCLKHMNRLRDAVCRSVRCQLGPSAQQQLRQARKRWPDAQAQPQRDPEPWVYPEWRQGSYLKGEEDVVILKAGSPAPLLHP